MWTQNNPRQICKSIQSSAKQNSASVQKPTEVSAPAWSLPHLAPSPLPSSQHRAVQVMEWDTISVFLRSLNDPWKAQKQIPNNDASGLQSSSQHLLRQMWILEEYLLLDQFCDAVQKASLALVGISHGQQKYFVVTTNYRLKVSLFVQGLRFSCLWW